MHVAFVEQYYHYLVHVHVKNQKAIITMWFILRKGVVTLPTRKNEARWIESRQRWQINVQNDGERKTFTSATIGPKGKITAEKAADKWLESKHTKDVRFNVLWDRFLEV